MPDAEPTEPHASLKHEHDTATLGMWTFLATEVLFFGGLVLGYAIYRHAYSQAFAEAARHTNIVIGAANTAIMLTSSFLVAWGIELTKAGLSRFMAWLFAAAAILGAVFLALKGLEYRGEVLEGLYPGPGFALGGEGTRLFFIVYFVATGLHGLHVAIGVVVLAVISLRAWQGTYSPVDHSPPVLAGLYWHFVDFVWVFLFALIYLPGRA
jgi:cytochrome c oxidase subunit 3